MPEGPAGRRMVLYGATGIVAGAAAWALASVLLGADTDELGSGVVPALIGIVLAAVIAAAAARAVAALLRDRDEALRKAEERADYERRRAAALDRARRAERAW